MRPWIVIHLHKMFSPLTVTFLKYQFHDLGRGLERRITADPGSRNGCERAGDTQQAASRRGSCCRQTLRRGRRRQWPDERRELGGERETRSPRYTETQSRLKQRKESIVNQNADSSGEPSWGKAKVPQVPVTPGALKAARSRSQSWCSEVWMWRQ